ncbi:MAG TPA: glycosyltransferase family 39 protein [Candidatus Nanoarchaeia archaeon]|nr:glycosyltransferase family 39 protein [Candidatus Nanoarchaeia archaeon]
MKIKKNQLVYIYLIAIFVFVLLFRLYFTLTIDTFNDDVAYFHERSVEYILENKLPMSYDVLSYGGKGNAYPFVYHYLLSFFSLFFPLEMVLKIIPEILFALIIIIIFLIAKELTNDDRASLLSALMAGFVPLFIRDTLNKASIFSLFLFILLTLFYCILKVKNDNKYVILIIILSILLPLIYPSFIVYIVALLFYVLLSLSEDVNIARIRKEIILFSFFLVLFVGFFYYKNVIFEYGFDFLRLGIPNRLFLDYFQGLDFFILTYYVGIVPLIFGAFGIYYGLQKANRKDLFLIIGLFLSSLILMFLRLLEFSIGFIVISMALILLSAFSFNKVFDMIKMSKFSRFQFTTSIILLVIIMLFLIIPSFNLSLEIKKNAISKEEIEILKWANMNLEDGAIIYSDLSEGNLVTTIANKKSFIDKNFLLAPNVNQRIEDAELLATTWNRALALQKIKNYGINYLLLTDYLRDRYDIKEIKYFDDVCFDKVIGIERGAIYKVLC